MTGPTAAEVLLASLRTSVERLETHLGVAAEGRDPEGVHQSRVALRRLRSDLGTYESLFETVWARDLRRELRWLGRALAAARDADVLVLRAAEPSAGRPAVSRARMDAMHRALRDEQDATHEELRQVLASKRQARLLARLASAAAHPRFSPLANGSAATAMVPLLRGPLDELSRTADRARNRPTDPRLHRVRIAAKHVRYAATTASEVVPHAGALAAAAEGLQDVLGEYQDAVVAAGWAERFGDLALAAYERAEGAIPLARWEAAFDEVLAAERGLAA